MDLVVVDVDVVVVVCKVVVSRVSIISVFGEKGDFVNVPSLVNTASCSRRNSRLGLTINPF